MSPLLPHTKNTVDTILQCAVTELEKKLDDLTQERATLLDTYHAQNENMSEDTRTTFTHKQTELDSEIEGYSCLLNAITAVDADTLLSSSDSVSDYSLFDIHETTFHQENEEAPLNRESKDVTMLLLPHHCRTQTFYFEINESQRMCITNQSHWAYGKAKGDGYDIGKPGFEKDERSAGERWQATGGHGQITHIYSA